MIPGPSVDKIFDAFVSTKKNGMGIGLSISRSMRGSSPASELWAENNPDCGAKFSLLLGTPEPTTTGD